MTEHTLKLLKARKNALLADYNRRYTVVNTETVELKRAMAEIEEIRCEIDAELKTRLKRRRADDFNDMVKKERTSYDFKDE